MSFWHIVCGGRKGTSETFKVSQWGEVERVGVVSAGKMGKADGRRKGVCWSVLLQWCGLPW